MVKLKQENETKRERFIRLTETRTQKVLDSLRILGNCSNLQNYDYFRDDIVNIFNEIERATKRMKNQFLNTIEKRKNRLEKFTLKSL